jgi:3-hydroxyisobutyrate dehydrogenase-like beta-hydroxyacid dehydrogenase
MATIGLLHPGDMGAAVGAALAGAGHEVLWASDGRSEASARRAAEAGLTDVGDVGGVLARAQVVFSIVPPHAAREVAGAARDYAGVWVDANAIAPATARAVAAGVARYVDGGIVGPPPHRAGTTRLYLSGAGAADVAALLDGTPLEAIDLGPDPTAASAIKMAYAAWTKGSAALLLATRELAERLGVGDALAAENARSQPGLDARWESARASARAKGWRWIGEMEEIARAFADAGLPPGFHQAAADVYRSDA